MLLLLIACSPSPPERVQLEDAWVRVDSRADVRALADAGLNYVEQRRPGQVRVHGTPAQLDALGAAVVERGPLPPPPMADGYHSVEELDTALVGLASLGHELIHVGTSAEGRPLLGLRMGPQDAPAVRILGGHHGDERSSVELALAVARALDAGEGSYQGLLDTRQVFVVPQVNPDGVDAGTRYNANQVDLNRNYDVEWDPDNPTAGDAPFSETETTSIRSWSLTQGYTRGLSIHAGEINIGYPWNYTDTPSPEQDALVELAEDYGADCSWPGFWVTAGSDWYITYGDTNDWSLGRTGTLDFTLEVSLDKTPDLDTLEGLIDAHLPAIAEFIAAPLPLTGRVLDAETGRPIPARLQLDGSPFLNVPDSGRFARGLSGSSELWVTAPGYQTQSVDVSPEMDLEIALEPSNREALRPSPAIIRADDGEVELELPELSEAPDTLRLMRPGFEDVLVAGAAGRWTIDASTLAPGAWTLGLGTVTIPRGLLVEGAPVRGLAWGSTLELQVDNRVGVRVWALHGDDRALIPLPVLDRESDRVIVDPSPIEGVVGTIDLVLMSDGEQTAVADIASAPGLDTALDSASTPSATEEIVGYRGCSTGPRPGWTITLLALLASRRRRACT